jgi:hypothetical protein
MTGPRSAVGKMQGVDWAPMKAIACIYVKMRLTPRCEYQRTWSEDKVEAINCDRSLEGSSREPHNVRVRQQP